MIQVAKDLGDISEPVLVFGGPYGNVQATEAILARAKHLKIPPERIICTGDVVAYCGDAAATVAAIRQSKIHVVMGNCEESLGQDLPDCGCGFAEGSDCDLLSVQWFAHARQAIGANDKAWMSRLPEKLTFTMNGRKLAVIHGAAEEIGRFVFLSTPTDEKTRDLDTLAVDGVIAGHCGLPFSQVIDNRLWHNAGVVGMPANDGTPRTWYSLLTPGPEGIEVAIFPLDHDHETAASRMHDQAMPEAYARTLTDGLWPNMDVLPAAERQNRGQPLQAEIILWR